MEKRAYRQAILQALKNQKSGVKQAADARLLDGILNSPSYQKARTIATYLSMDHEFNTAPLIARAQADGKKVLVPKVLGPGQMIFVPYEPQNLSMSSFGVLEPESSQAMPQSAIDLIHVPGLVFNNHGFRIGYGGGFYDRYLVDYRGHTLASLYGFQLEVFEPDSHDIAVKELIVDEG